MLFDPRGLLSRLPVQVTDYQAVVSPFDDATHSVYQLSTAQGAFALKVLREKQTPFWRGMDALFDVKLTQQVTRSAEHYACAADVFSLHVPTLIDYAGISAQSPAYLLTTWLAGEPIDSVSISAQLIEDMAYADAQRHQKKLMTWGCAVDPSYSMQDWQARIASILPNVTSSALSILLNSDGFVPMIMDMRWDQCLQQQGRLSALVDIDALVYAPKALELVLMEYWLTPEQLAVWSLAYLSAGGELPNLKGLRKTYRQLLWSWHIMGRLSKAEWMAWPEFFA